jgi:hypothetical protein
VSRPPEIACRLPVAFASHTGGYIGASRMSVKNPIRLVAPAAAASAVIVS